MASVGALSTTAYAISDIGYRLPAASLRRHERSLHRSEPVPGEAAPDRRVYNPVPGERSPAGPRRGGPAHGATETPMPGSLPAFARLDRSLGPGTTPSSHSSPGRRQVRRWRASPLG